MFYDGQAFYHSRKYHIDHIVDRIGGGDAFSGGFIYGILTGMTPARHGGVCHGGLVPETHDSARFQPGHAG